MILPQNETKVLLVGRGLRKIDQMIDALNMAGVELMLADDAAEGLKMLCLESPDLVVCQIDLADGQAAEFCRTVRSNPRFAKTPFIFAGGSLDGMNDVFRALDAGADDLFTEHFSSEHFLAKLVWMIEQKSLESALFEQYLNMRRRQSQTIGIIKETSELFQRLELERRSNSSSGYSVIEQKIEVGMGLISGLAGILEEQIKAVDTWFARGRNSEDILDQSLLSDPIVSNVEFAELSLPM